MAGNNTEQTIDVGARVTLSFTLLLADGTVVEGTEDGEPLTIVVGESELLPAFERCLIGLKAGERRRFEIDCLDAFGPVDADNVHALPRADFPADMALAEGTVVGFSLPDGREVAGTVVGLNEAEVQVNFSHPLAGRDVVFEVEILDVRPGATTVA